MCSVLVNLEHYEYDIWLRLIYNVYNRAEYRLNNKGVFLRSYILIVRLA
jgi:hypothetical protein